MASHAGRSGSLLIAGLILLAGCTASPSPVLPSSSSGNNTAPTGQADPTSVLTPSAIAAFGGACSTVMSDADVTAAFGREMILLETRWSSGAEELAGGLVCTWSTPEEYAGAVLEVISYPDEDVPDDVRSAWAEPRCDGSEFVSCTASGRAGNTWIYVSASPSSVDFVSTMWTAVAAREASAARPRAASPLAQWWSLPTCEELDASVDFPAIDDVPDLTLTASTPLNPAHPHYLPDKMGREITCSWQGPYDEADPERWGAVTATVIPGAGSYIETASSSPGATPLSVPGATAAVLVPDNDLFETHTQSLLVSDGDNLVIVTPGQLSGEPGPTPIAAALLAALEER